MEVLSSPFGTPENYQSATKWIRYLLRFLELLWSDPGDDDGVSANDRGAGECDFLVVTTYLLSLGL